MKHLYSNLVVFFFLPLIFVLFSFYPTAYEILNKNKIPGNREFTLDHNYVFDFNFYLSRIREGQEGKWLVLEKYYHLEHSSSLFQIVYLYMGKVGGIFGLDPVTIYHGGRLLFGFILLVSILSYLSNLFGVKKAVLAFLLVVTAGSWPILVKVSEGIHILGWRSATYMGWWSSQDSLQRITYIPHVLIGQIFLTIFVVRYSLIVIRSSKDEKRKTMNGFLLPYGFLGLLAGIIFPPTLVILYAWFGIESALEFLMDKKWSNGQMVIWLKNSIVPRVVFCLISGISFIYLQLMFNVLPWSALATFDIRHRMPLPFADYILSLGPVFILGILGGLIVLLKREKRFYPFISWIIANFFLIFIFWNIPTQSPLRFTQSAIYIPSGILAFYFIRYLSHLRYLGHLAAKTIYMCVIAVSLFVMISMVGWLTDQIRAKSAGTFLYPTGAQLIYPLKNFMEGIYFLKDETNQNSAVLAAETAGNFIPAYAGNYVYYGHANTPDDNLKKNMIEKFFSGKMTQDEAKKFLIEERIKYIYFGPQEREFAKGKSLSEFYPDLKNIYSNKAVSIFRFN